MAQFSSLALTEAGVALQTKVQTGAQFQFTRVAIGDGAVSDNISLNRLTGLISERLSVAISNLSTSNGRVTLKVNFSNENVTESFYIRELGVFANDPDAGEILYAVANAGDKADYLPAYGGAEVIEQVFTISLLVDSAADVTATFAESIYVLKAGDTMTGPLILSGDPTANLQAVTKQYTDQAVRFWQPDKAYAVGDICYSATAASYKYFECTQAGTSGATEPTWPGVGETITDGTATWRVRDIKSGSGVQIGTIMPFLALSAPSGWLACDTGALVSRTTYIELWAWVQDNAPLLTEVEWQTMAAAQTSVGYYSSGDGSTTFRLPRIVDFVRGGAVGSAGVWQSDAIRNIIGKVSHMQSGHNNPANIKPTGPFTITDTKVDGNATGGAAIVDIGFDASLAVPTADENRPKNIAMLYCVKAFDAVVNEGLIDVTELANEVAGKQDRVLYGLIVDEKPSGTDGGSFTSGAWRTRDLNTIKHNENNFALLSNNQITLPKGTYRISAKCPTGGGDSHKARLYNMTDSISALIGTSENATSASASDSVYTSSIVVGKIILEQVTTLELQHRINTTKTNNGFGGANNFDEPEIYSTIEIWKEA